MKADFLTLMSRVNSAPDAPTLRDMETLATRVYDAGQLTPRELSRVDVRIMERLATLPRGYAIKTPKGYFATQGSMQWCQDTPEGWALYSTEEHARAVLEYAAHVEGIIQTIPA